MRAHYISKYKDQSADPHPPPPRPDGDPQKAREMEFVIWVPGMSAVNPASRRRRRVPSRGGTPLLNEMEIDYEKRNHS